MSSHKSSINLSYLHAAFINCKSFKPLCTKEYVPLNSRGSLCKNFFLPFSAWLYLFTINREPIRLFKTPPFRRGLVWRPGRWRQREPWNLAHTLSVVCGLAPRQIYTQFFRGYYWPEFRALRVFTYSWRKRPRRVMRTALPLNESVKFLTHCRTSGRKTAQIYFVAVVLESTMKVRFF